MRQPPIPALLRRQPALYTPHTATLVNPIQYRSPIWGQTALIPSDLPPKRDWGPKRVNPIYSKRFNRHYSGRAALLNRHCRGATTAVVLAVRMRQNAHGVSTRYQIVRCVKCAFAARKGHLPALPPPSSRH